jgi:hypothetical protein
VLKGCGKLKIGISAFHNIQFTLMIVNEERRKWDTLLLMFGSPTYTCGDGGHEGHPFLSCSPLLRSLHQSAIDSRSTGLESYKHW